MSGGAKKIVGGPKKESSILSIEEYRRLLDDSESTDERIIERLQYIESFCRAIIRTELQNYAKKPTR